MLDRDINKNKKEYIVSRDTAIKNSAVKNSAVKNSNDKNMSQPIKKAVALKYDAYENPAPKIIAKGSGIISEKIIEKAMENDIPIYYDANLTEILTTLNLGDEIPPELYEVVAKILVFIGYMDEKYGEKQKHE